jgi:hypothetical protein
MYLSLRCFSADEKPVASGFEAKRHEAFQVEMSAESELAISVSHMITSLARNQVVDFQIAEGVEVVMQTPTSIKLRFSPGQTVGKFCLIADGINVSGLLKVAQKVRFSLPRA